MTTSAPPAGGAPSTGSSAGRIVAAAFGGLLALIAVGLLLGGIALAVVHGVARGDDGYFTSSTERLATGTAAITGEDVDLGDLHGDAGDWVVDTLDTSARITATARGGEPIFLGVARDADVDAYLRGVAHDEVTDVDGGDVAYRRSPGRRRAEPPARHDIWVASAQGTGTQRLTWEPEAGRWSAVLMRPNGRPGVAADVSVGAKTDALLWIAIALLVAGVAAAALAALLIWLGVRTPGPSGSGPAREREPVRRAPEDDRP